MANVCQYPRVAPAWTIDEPKGIDDTQLTQLERELRDQVCVRSRAHMRAERSVCA